MNKEHKYHTTVKWTGNKGQGTLNYQAYGREHKITVENKPDILGSADPAFRGDKMKHNPEEMLVASLSACHMLWYLHLCAEAGIIVTEYADSATGIMIETQNGGGKFKEVILNPVVVITNKTMIEKAIELHHKASELCFIANSINFPLFHNPDIKTVKTDSSINLR